MKTDAQAKLESAKSKRAKATTAVPVAATIAAANLLDLKAWRAEVVAVGDVRAAAIAAAKPTDVRAANDARDTAEIAAEISAKRAEASAATHAAAVQALRDADAGVAAAARAVIDGEMIELAREFTAAHDHAMRLGAKLQMLANTNPLFRPLNMAPRTLPPEVERALKLLPAPNELEIPVHLLRNGAYSDAYERRFAELTV
jgi:hypothetical protein